MAYSFEMVSAQVLDVSLTVGAVAVVAAFALAIVAIWTADLARRRRDVQRLSAMFGDLIAQATQDVGAADGPDHTRSSATKPLGKRRVPR